MKNNLKFYINGHWVSPSIGATLDVINPATEKPYTQISLGSKMDVDQAVAAANLAFKTFSKQTPKERLQLLQEILHAYHKRIDEIAEAITEEMGAPKTFARDAQAWAGSAQLEATIDALKNFDFEEQRGTSLIRKEPIGVCAMITPWNWPINQVVCKVAPAIAAGCTMVLKPSEIAPISAILFAEIMHEAGTPQGVFNLVNGTGADVGRRLAGHPDVQMISFTGSTLAGIDVAKIAADTVKRVTQELGGKSANVLLPEVDLQSAVIQGIQNCYINSGQSCVCPSRMLVPEEHLDEIIAIAKTTAEAFITGDPQAENTQLGPVVSQMQYDKVQRLIQSGIDEGATLITGGTGRPNHLKRGYYIRPTIFAHVTSNMSIAQEEIFGPVLAIMSYKNLEEAIHIANDTPYGLAAYVQSKNLAQARAVAKEMRAGSVFINYPNWDIGMPFGGYKQSGNGRESAGYGIHEYLEIKSMVGYGE